MTKKGQLYSAQPHRWLRSKRKYPAGCRSAFEPYEKLRVCFSILLLASISLPAEGAKGTSYTWPAEEVLEGQFAGATRVPRELNLIRDVGANEQVKQSIAPRQVKTLELNGPDTRGPSNGLVLNRPEEPPSSSNSKGPTSFRFAVQVGAMENREEALALAKELSTQYKQTVVVDPVEVRGKTLYRVRLRTETRAQAKELAARLKRERELKTWIVKID